MSDPAKEAAAQGAGGGLHPSAVGLKEALELIDRSFGIEKVLADRGKDRLAEYYHQSRIGYDRLHSARGCMHAALNRDGVYHPRGFRAQAKAAAWIINQIGARDILELGCGLGFNTRILAEQFPQCRFVGIDLLADHVAEARKRSEGFGNLTFEQASYEPIPETLGQFDVVLAVETLCYASDPKFVARSVSRALRPGGRFLMFDGFRRSALEDMTPDMALATQLYEVSVAVTGGFWHMRDWKRAFRQAGFEPVPTRDLSDLTLPGMRVLQEKALHFLTDWKLRLAGKALPTYLARNAIAGVLGPLVTHDPGPSPVLAVGGIEYARLSAFKPA